MVMARSTGRQPRDGVTAVDSATPRIDLVRAAQDGDHRAFVTLVGEVDEQMRRFAHLMLGSRAVMDLALRDAYLTAYRRFSTFDGRPPFVVWLYGVVHRACRDRLRLRGGGRGIEIDLVAPSDPRLAAVRDLPLDQLAVVALVDGGGLPAADAAAVLGVSERVVGRLHRRAHDTLRTVLQEQEKSS